MAALVNGTFAYNTQSVITLVATRSTKIKIQPRANTSNSRIFTQTYKYYTYYKKDQYYNSKYITLYPYLKKENNRGGNSNNRRRGYRYSRYNSRSSRRGNNNNNNNTLNKFKPSTNTQVTIIVTESTAFQLYSLY